MALTGLVAANNLSDVVDIERTWDNIGNNISATVFVPAATLDLNFAGNKSLVDNISGSGLVTFTRASSGTFVGSNGLIQTAASGVPRFDHDPVTGESLGLLVEEARTNVAIYSEQLDQWTNDGTTVSINAIASPDGNTTADLVTAVSGNKRIYTLRTISNGPVYTYSIFIKKNVGSVVGFSNINVGDTSTTFNFDTGILTVSLFSSGSVVSYGNGWYRLSLTYTSNGLSAGLALVFTAISDSCYMWGYQFEQGSFPTSYIPTTSSTVTRAADVASITGTNFTNLYVPSQGTIYVQAPTGQGNYSALIELRSSNPADSPQLLSRYGGNSVQFSVPQSGDYTNRTRQLSYTPLASNKYIGAYQSANSCVGVNGSLGATITGSIGTGGNAFVIGRNRLDGDFHNKTIARLVYYPIRLSNITLQALTTLGPVSSFLYSFSIKGRDILALKEANKASTRDFVFIKGLTSKVQPRITIAFQYTVSGVAFQQNALLKASPSSVGNYSVRSVLTTNALKINGNNVASLALSPFSATVATTGISISSLGLGGTLRWTPVMSSGTIASPTVAIPVDFSSFILYAKAGQN